MLPQAPGATLCPATHAASSLEVVRPAPKAPGSRQARTVILVAIRVGADSREGEQGC